MDAAQKAGESGAEVGGTGLQGPAEMPTRKSETLGTGMNLYHDLTD